MLRRINLGRNFRLTARCLSDKPTDDANPPVVQAADRNSKEKKPDPKITDKIQILLKQMLEAKGKESEQRDFGFAQERPKGRQLKNDEIEVKTEKIEDSITKAASDVAQAIGGDVKQTEAELLSRVLGKINQTSTSLSDLILGMKVDQSQSSDDHQPETRGQQVRRLVNKSKQEQQTRFGQRKERPTLESRPKSTPPQAVSLDIFGGDRLNIFSVREPNYGTKLQTWEELKQRELSLATAQPPANYFQKMIQWTKQGKVWKFPINNEQGLEAENEIHFSDHIFLDSHLEDWCPRKGPIRHFMELVCVGLSKNPFYTAQEKKDHILWYKEYFESKKDLLTEVGAWEIMSSKKEQPSA